MLQTILLFVNKTGLQILIPLKFIEKYVQKIHHLYGQVCQLDKYQHPQLFKGIQKKTFSTVRNQIADKFNAFLELDKINHTNLKESLLNNKKDFVCLVVAFLDEDIYIFNHHNLLIVFHLYVENL